MWILGYSPTTLAATSIEFSGRFPISSIFLRKFPEFLMYDQLLCMTGFKWWSKNSDAFSVGMPKLDIMGCPGTLKSFLWILGRRYNFPKLVAFLYSYKNYFISFSDMANFLSRLLNILLLLATQSLSIFSLNETSL